LVEFLSSIGILGYLIIGILILFVANLRGIISLRSPLDSQQHKIWRATGGVTKPDHLERKEKD